MGRKFQPARLPVGEAPDVQSMQYDSAQTFKSGAVIVFEGGATGEVIEGSSDPTPIVGVALEAANSKPGYELGHASSVLQVTGRVQQVSVAKANRSTVWSGRMVNGATDPKTPALTDINVVYGVAKVGDDWVVNQAETSATRVEIVDIDIDNKIVFFKFMEAHLAQP
jgi:hypothetical protein